MTRAFGWKSLVAAGALLVTILAGVLAARQRAGDGARDVARGAATTASQSAVIQSGLWMSTLRNEGGGPIVEVQLDEVLGELGRGVVLDRPALLVVLQGVAGPDPQIEGKRVADVLGKVSRVRVTSQGLSIVLGRRALTQALQHIIGGSGAVEEMSVGQVLDVRRGHGLAGAGPVLLVVDVEAFVFLREERRHRSPLARSCLRDDSRPRDLERTVLHVDLRQGLVLAGVPCDVEMGLLEQRTHHLSIDDPHLSRVLLHELDCADGVGLGRRQ